MEYQTAVDDPKEIVQPRRSRRIKLSSTIEMSINIEMKQLRRE